MVKSKLILIPHLSVDQTGPASAEPWPFLSSPFHLSQCVQHFLCGPWWDRVEYDTVHMYEWNSEGLWIPYIMWKYVEMAFLSMRSVASVRFLGGSLTRMCRDTHKRVDFPIGTGMYWKEHLVLEKNPKENGTIC